MRFFASDNSSGIHPRFLAAIADANEGHYPSYGQDPFTERFDAAIRRAFGAGAEAFLVFNGTAANVLGLATAVKSHEGVICADSSHLNVDECGAPERWLGAKLFVTPAKDGKLDLAGIRRHMTRLGDQHHSQPRALSVTQPTELGTVYSLSELRELAAFCRENRLFFHIDGARLANAAAFLECSLADTTSGAGCDVLSLGGTKNGMLGAEAVVFFRPELARDFKFHRKQGLQLASKHRFLAAQFSTYLESGLWLEIARHTHGLALHLAELLRGLTEVEIIAPIQSNAVFAKVPKRLIRPLREKFFFYVWDEFEWVVRWMVTWDHTRDDIEAFAEAIRESLASGKEEP
ncbi:MAG: threonine aldolase [Acidobacteria bacterium]|nr:threonine aldolase [Acidobacteriota bacterium]MCG3192380.1 Low specificity L-threonine aldolase [Thermoanaerobaculia bacterium]